MSAQWFQVYEARFGKKLSPDEITVWESEIERDIRNLRPGELIDAIRAIAEDDRKAGGGKRRFAPDAETIISAIIRRRYQANKEAAPTAKCELCSDGWISFGFIPSTQGLDAVKGCSGITTGNIVRKIEPGACISSTFCRCDRGNAHMQNSIRAGRTTMESARALQERVWETLFPMASFQ